MLFKLLAESRSSAGGGGLETGSRPLKTALVWKRSLCGQVKEEKKGQK
jgi:hypothetical protein